MSEFTIRAATPADRDAIVRLGWHFAISDVFRDWLEAATEESVGKITDLMLAAPQACIALAVDVGDVPFGLIALLELPNLVTGVNYLDELVWWVEPTRRAYRAGPALLAFAEDWARMRGIRTIKMVAPFGSTVGRFYERRGYRAAETVYAKVLQP